MSYWLQADLEALIGKPVVLAIFDDDRQGYVNPAYLSQVQALSDSTVDGALARVYPGPFPIVQQFPVWAAGASYAVGAAVVPPAATGYSYRCVLPGVAGGGQPAWGSNFGAQFTDGGVTWQTSSLVPELVRMASLLWGKALAYERHPEYVKMFGSGPRKEAQAYLDRLVAAREYLTDALNMGKPGNVGGLITNSGPRMIIDNPDGTSNSGDF